jgi:CheY-like chemotaxis protein
MSHPIKHILCIDDEADILQVAKMALETVGKFQVSTCLSGKEALEKITDIKPDMVLLDVMMPGMDGPTTYAKLRALAGFADIPVIFMTAKVQPKEVASYIGLGAVGVILKPFDPMQLSQEVIELCKNSRARFPQEG